MKIAIIGGGASGLMLACELEKSHIDYDLFEASKKLGSKIIVSGNGKCNFTNLNLNINHFNNPNFIKSFINECSLNDILNKFKELGLTYKKDGEGRFYPSSESSNQVLNSFLNHLDLKKIKYETVTSLELNDDKFILNHNYLYDKVVVGIGSKAGNGFESNSLIDDLIKLGHNRTKLIPSLSCLGVKNNIAILENIRLKSIVKLTIDDEEFIKEGEVLFKKDYISGIVIFELSSILARKMATKNIEKATISIELSDYKDFCINENENLKIIDLLSCSFNKNLAIYLLKELGIDQNKKLFNLSIDELNKLKTLNKFSIILDVNLDFKSNNYQVICGGFDLNNINTNLESKIIKNLYFMGECLDIDGDCGGYNLSFAWLSGLRVSKEVINNEKNN